MAVVAATASTEPSNPKWWRIFRRPTLTERDRTGNTASDPLRPGGGQSRAVFGVALATSLRYASVGISQVGDDGKARIYGHIPVVVAKSGLFLKENGAPSSKATKAQSHADVVLAAKAPRPLVSFAFRAQTSGSRSLNTSLMLPPRAYPACPLTLLFRFCVSLIIRLSLNLAQLWQRPHMGIVQCT